MLRANWIKLRHSAELINRESVPVAGALFRAVLGLLLLTATDVSTTCAVVVFRARSPWILRVNWIKLPALARGPLHFASILDSFASP